ncbi:IscS subfamily cysteine desulfurase [Mycoplasmatota bacterium]|nr:IscS subfamily cysteine desulfurase [Mycoplasmatota bacterium]
MRDFYFDYASTTQIRKEVYEEMIPYLHNEYGNPSSLYEIGINNKKVINQCRKKIASLLNAKGNEIYFCSGGSEANNWALKGIAFSSSTKKEIITTKIEHHAVLHTCSFLEKIGYIVHYLNVNEEGFIDIDELEKTINDNTLMVSIMMANNEIGTIQNIKKIGKLCKEKNVIFHTDAVQAIPHIQLDVEALHIDLLSISAHKFYGPKGIGCLYIQNGIEIENLIHGGGQEKGKRAGTENVAYIVGMRKALELIYQDIHEHNMKERFLSQKLYALLKEKIKDIKLNGPEIGNNRLPGNLNLSFKGIDGALMSYELNKEGIAVSTGSACNSGSIEPSHVLQAIQVPDEYIKGTIRITLGKDTTIDDIEVISQSIIAYINKNSY